MNARNLYCNGIESCEYSLLISNFDTIFGYGRHSLAYSSIENINMVYCTAHRACTGATIVNVFDNVYGAGYRALFDSNVRDVGNTVIGLGYQALSNSRIYNVSNIFCASTQSCENSRMIEIYNEMQANGDSSLSNSVIISGGH